MISSPRMLRIAVGGALLGLALIVADSVAIAVHDGSGESTLDLVLFLAGIAVLLTSVVALGLHLSSGRPAAVRTATCVGLLVGITLVVVAVQLIVEAVQPDDPGWAWGEVNLWVVAAAVCALALGAARRQSVRVAGTIAGSR